MSCAAHGIAQKLRESSIQGLQSHCWLPLGLLRAQQEAYAYGWCERHPCYAAPHVIRKASETLTRMADSQCLPVTRGAAVTSVCDCSFTRDEMVLSMLLPLLCFCLPGPSSPPSVKSVAFRPDRRTAMSGLSTATTTRNYGNLTCSCLQPWPVCHTLDCIATFLFAPPLVAQYVAVDPRVPVGRPLVSCSPALLMARALALSPDAHVTGRVH